MCWLAPSNHILPKPQPQSCGLNICKAHLILKMCSALVSDGCMDWEHTSGGPEPGGEPAAQEGLKCRQAHHHCNDVAPFAASSSDYIRQGDFKLPCSGRSQRPPAQPGPTSCLKPHVYLGSRPSCWLVLAVFSLILGLERMLLAAATHRCY